MFEGLPKDEAKVQHNIEFEFMLHIAYKSNKVFLNNNIEEKIMCQLIRMTVLPFMFLILLLTTDIVLEEETKEIETSVRR